MVESNELMEEVRCEMKMVERKHAVVQTRTREHMLAKNARMHTLQRNHFLPLPPSPEKKEKKKHGSHNRKCSRSWRMKKRSGSQLSSLFPFHLCLFSSFPLFIVEWKNWKYRMRKDVCNPKTSPFSIRAITWWVVIGQFVHRFVWSVRGPQAPNSI